MATTSSDDIPSSGLALWDIMVSRAGLELRRRKQALPSYDHELEASVARTLGFAAEASLRDQLRKRAIAVEPLLQALLAALQPWSLMMSDILEMLVEAAANRAGDTLRLNLQLDKLSLALAETLEAFRTQSARAAQVVALRSGKMWGVLDPWSLAPHERHAWSGAGHSRPTPMLDWAARYQNWPRDVEGGQEPPPAFSASGDAELDRQLVRLRELVSSFISAASVLGSTYRQRVSHLHASSLGRDWDLGDGWRVGTVAAADSDFLPAYICRIFEEVLQASDLHTRASGLAAELGAKLDVAPDAPRLEKRIEQLAELFDLPIWRKRHELYSVWVSSVIRRRLPVLRTWAVEDGSLDYSFAGSRLAWSEIEGLSWALWTELRRTLLAPVGKGRRRNVQPDYTLVRDKEDREAPASLIVECKQYRRQSRRNFREALVDYAAAHPQAHVLLVNYGPASSTLADDIEHQRPVLAFGEVRPGGKGLGAFDKAVEAALEDMCGDFASDIIRAQHEAEVRKKHNRLAEASIRLSWQNSADLDLHLRVRTPDQCHHVFFSALGSDEEAPWALHGGDIRKGPGAEMVRIFRWCEGTYHIWVHRYTGEWPDAPQVELLLEDVGRTYICTSATGDEWQVCRIVVDSALSCRIVDM